MEEKILHLIPDKKKLGNQMLILIANNWIILIQPTEKSSLLKNLHRKNKA